MRKFIPLGLLALVPMALFAARLTLRDGRVVSGEFISGSSDNIVFRDGQGVRRTYPTREVQMLDFDNLSNPAANARIDSRDRVDNGRHIWTTLPAGTEISVRNDETITADTAVEGRTYPASIQRDVADNNGQIVLPRGSRANLVVLRSQEGGTFTGGNLMLDLDSVEVNGRRYRVSTEDLQRNNNRGIGANRRTGEMVGGGAVLGTLLGAIAGGGKGAAIGAVAGAAAGGGVQVLTKGKEIRVPAETVLNFRLDQPLPLREAN
jgi:hypothetical protein